MDNTDTNIRSDVARYYSAKIAEHGAMPRGVDWNGEESQMQRFAQFTKLIDGSRHFSINDLGCGYGALYPYLRTHFTDFSYYGCDISQAMIEKARELHTNGRAGPQFRLGDKPESVADYSVASGLFNVRVGRPDDVWLTYLIETLDCLSRFSCRGFAFNCLTSYSDPDKMRPDLYYADPLVLFDHCKKTYARDVALLHDYGLYEFTILVRKNDA